MRLILSFLIILISLFKTHAENLDPIKIGVIIPLSGNLAYVGEDIKKGIILGIDELKDKIKITPIFEDNAYDLKATVTAAHKLINQDKVKILFTLWDGADAVAPISEKAGVLNLAIRWNPDVTKDRPLMFTFESTFRTYERDQVELLKSLGIKRFAILQTEAQGWMLGAQELKQLAPLSGLEVVGHQEFMRSESDFKSILLKALSKSPDILVLLTDHPTTQIILRQLNQLRPGFRHTGYYDEIPEHERTLIEGFPYVGQFEFSPEFQEKFKAKFGELAKIRASHAYELIRIINWAYSNLPPGKAATPQNLAAMISTLKDFDSSLGKLSTNSTRNIEHPDVWKVWKNGRSFVVPVGGKLS